MISLARDIFEDAREASFELYRHDLKYNAMEARALSLGGATDVHVASGGIADRTRAVDAMVDYEALMERKAARWCEMVDRAVRVLYGDDWEHGIAASLSMSHAEVLDCIYVQRMSLTPRPSASSGASTRCASCAARRSTISTRWASSPP